MTGTEALEIVATFLNNEPVVLANGYISREFFNVQDREGSFYMIGSMGLASSIGLGAALARPDRKTVIVDGDGNVLMSMGTLAMIAAARPKNLVHLCIDNEVYESTGKQRSLSNQIELEKVAQANGYPYSKRVDTPDALKQAMGEVMAGEGPSFLLIKVAPSFDSNRGRVTHTPEEIRDRFMSVYG